MNNKNAKDIVNDAVDNLPALYSPSTKNKIIKEPGTFADVIHR